MMHRAALSLLLLAAGGTAAATLYASARPLKSSASAQLKHAAAVWPGRVEVSPASVRDAYAKGLVAAPIKTVLNVPGRMIYGDYLWDDKGVAAGRVWVRVDLRSQILSVFRGEHEIGTAVVLYGADGLPTPTGKFPVLAKLKDHRSATYDNAPMPYTLRLTPDGVSIHGSNVRWGYATHGCVGVPAAFAAKLFAAVSVGDEVLIVGGKTA